MGPDVWPEYDMFVWHVMAVCVDCFVGNFMSQLVLRTKLSLHAFD